MKGPHPLAWAFAIGGIAIVLVAGGCGFNPPPAPVATPIPVVTPIPAVKPMPAVEAPAAESAIPTSVEPVKPAEAPAPPAPTFATERVLLLTPRNPLIVEFQLSIDGQPHVQALDRLVQDVLKLADTDGDGRPTWKEVTESKRFKYGQFGNVAINNENDYKQVIERYDGDKDGAVDANELPRFLTRNAGSARAFSVRGFANFRNAGGRGSPLWVLIDADEDNVISAEERAAAPGRMLSRDTDDDEILVPGDVNPRVPLDNGMGERRRGGSTVIRMLGPFADWDAIRLAIEREYSGNSSIRADAFPLTPELFPVLDKNNDGRLVKAEYAALNDVPPHVVIAVSFGREGEAVVSQERAEPSDTKDAMPSATKETEAPADPADKKEPETPVPPPVPQLRLVSIAPHLAEAPQGESAASAAQYPGRLMFRVGGTPITFYLNDTVAGGDYDAQAKQALMALDADKNGYLEEKEVPENVATQLGQFAAVDTDENGKVYTDEIIAFLKQQQAGLRAQIHARASDRDDALFAAVDQDHDERLDAREIDAIPERLALLDISGDGQLSADEIPASLIVGLARGNLENMDAIFVIPPLVARAPAEGTPRWFTSMDANGDGAISRREFIGPAEKFGSLDKSGDGLVDVVEAKSIEPPAGP